jgi:hypothetical protein
MMAKRFTDTKKWGKTSFDELSNEMKLVWIFLCDNCDHAGIWDFNLRLLQFHLGQNITREAIESALGDKVVWLSDRKIFLPGFIDFQYGALNPENKVHKSVLTRLEKEGAIKDLASPLQGAKDKDKDKDKEKDKAKAKEKVKEKEKVTPAFDFDSVADQYPRPTAKPDGVKRMQKYITTQADYLDLVKAVNNYAVHVEIKETEMNYIKHLASFVGSSKSGHPWRYWINPDPRELEPDTSNKKIKPIRKSANDHHLAKIEEMERQQSEREVGS